MLATFVIFLREGIEASMIVAIVLAYLDRVGQRKHFKDVILGVAAALLLSGAAGVAAYLTIRTYAGSRVQTIFETATYLLAAGVLTYMTYWMRTHARTISSELRARADTALEGRERLGLVFLAFQAVGREGIETAVFTLAIVFAAGSGGHLAILGGVIGLAVSLVVAFCIYKLGKKLNIGRFFSVLGTVLMFFAAGLLVDAVENLQQLGWITFLAHPLWNTSGVLAEDSAPGDVFHSFLGYADRPTVLQAIVYVGFIATVLGVMAWRSPRRSARSHHPVTAPSSAAAPVSEPASASEPAATAESPVRPGRSVSV